MTETLLAVLIVLLLAGVVLLVFWLRRAAGDSPAMGERLSSLEKNLERIERGLRDEFARSRQEGAELARALREETVANLKGFNDSVLKQMTDVSHLQNQQMETFSAHLAKLSTSNEAKLEALKSAVEGRLAQLQQDNARRLEEMRLTVDEKLQGTLEKRLGESFKLVSDRLEQVHKGLGEMQTLALGVGDLKKVLTNVKTRGTWGEVALGSLLEQILTPEQYARNVATRPGQAERVEFAIKLPGRGEADSDVVWLPIDAKFPKEDYERLVEAADRADQAAQDDAIKQLENRLKEEAGKIRERYLEPPHTTDFGILFLPTEGLYAEALRRPGLMDFLQREHRVSLAGPTTLAALLNSLQMGFRTLAIQRRSSEVWNVLGAVKTEFGKFGDVIDKVQKKLNEASSVIDSAATRTRAIERKLRDVQALPFAGDVPVLPLAEGERETEKPANDL